METASGERRDVWKMRGIKILKCCLLSALWTLYLVFGSLLFTHLEFDNEMAEKMAIRENIEDKLAEIWYLGMEAGLEQRQFPLLNDTLAVQSFINDIAYDIGLKRLYEWNFSGGVHFCLSVISTIGFGHLAPKTQVGRLMCVLYGFFGIPFNVLVMCRFGKDVVVIMDFLYRGLVFVTPKFFHVSWCCPALIPNAVGTGDAQNHGINGAKDTESARNMNEQQTSEPTTSAPYRADIYAISSANFGGKETRPIPKIAWSSDVKGKTHHVTSQINLPLSSRSNITAEEEEQDTHRDLAETLSEDITAEPNTKCRQAHSPPWFVAVVAFAWLFLMSSIVYKMSKIGYYSPWTFLDCMYLNFVIMSTIGFGDMIFGRHEAMKGLGIVLDVIVTVGGLLILSALFDAACKIGQRAHDFFEIHCRMKRKRQTTNK